MNAIQSSAPEHKSSLLDDNEPLVPAITWLNMSGDVTITWDDTNREHILELVRAKMKQGYSFFILKPRAIKSFGNKKVSLKKESQLDKAVGLVVSDEDVAALIANLGDKDVEKVVNRGKAVLTLVPKSNSLNTTSRANTAEEVLSKQTVAVRPVVGG